MILVKSQNHIAKEVSCSNTELVCIGEMMYDGVGDQIRIEWSDLGYKLRDKCGNSNWINLKLGRLTSTFLIVCSINSLNSNGMNLDCTFSEPIIPYLEFSIKF